MSVRILVGDALDQLKTLPDESVQCCVTSPPYFGLRDYGMAGQIGIEPTPEEYVAKMVEVFREVRRVLDVNGTLWLNIGDSYAGSGRGGNPPDSPHKKQQTNRGTVALSDYPDMHDKLVESGAIGRKWVKAPAGYKQKDLIGIPWMLAFALRADGWYLRSDIIWQKPNPMPESVTDRPTKAHEYVFLLSKSATYFYDADAIAEDAVWLRDNNPEWQHQRAETNEKKGAGNRNGKSGGFTKWGTEPKGRGGANAFRGQGHMREGENGPANRDGRDMQDVGTGRTRNKRSVWTISTRAFSEAHFATMPPELAETCVKAGCPEGGTVLDPFGGAGTTGLVADRLSRNALLIELNPAYAEMARARIQNDNPMFATVTMGGAA